MATLIKPDHFSIERWTKLNMNVNVMTPNGVVPAPRDFFVFSGYAHFDKPTGQLVGTGDQDTDDQLTYVEYEVTDMFVGPHWLRLDEVCPIVVAAGHDQHKPDTAEALGYEITGIKAINLVSFGGFSRIELQVNLRVRGGWSGEVPSLAYQATAIGMLDPKSIGNEGVFFGMPGLN
jgi:hypothetical protein